MTSLAVRYFPSFLLFYLDKVSKYLSEERIEYYLQALLLVSLYTYNAERAADYFMCW